MAAIDDSELPAEDVAAEQRRAGNRGSGIERSIVVIFVPVASIFWNFRFGFWCFDAAWGKGVKIETTAAR
jgi:hypothetical protein